jgi:hypothetical protein
MAEGRWKHRHPLGGPRMQTSRNQKYRLPPALVRYLCGLGEHSEANRVTVQDDTQAQIREHLRHMRPPPEPGMRITDRRDEE